MFFSPFDNFMFNAIPIIVIIFFIIITSVILLGVIRAVRENIRNNSMEEVTIPARIITKGPMYGEGIATQHTHQILSPLKMSRVKEPSFPLAELLWDACGRRYRYADPPGHQIHTF